MIFVLARAARMLGFLLLTALLRLLWNMTLRDLFGTKTLDYWQAFRLLLIASILFGPA